MRAMIENVNYINLFNSIVYGWTLHTHNNAKQMRKRNRCTKRKKEKTYEKKKG